jgi:hypothetical protein
VRLELVPQGELHHARAAGCPAMLIGEVVPKSSPLIAIR